MRIIPRSYDGDADRVLVAAYWPGKVTKVHFFKVSRRIYKLLEAAMEVDHDPSEITERVPNG